MEVLNSMVKYKVNIIFKENGKSLNETITDVLKIEINNFNKLSCDYTYCSQSKGRLVNDW